MATLSEIREQFQQRLLTFLCRGSENSNPVLKGGGAMRVHTASARYTQDLDFDHDPHRSLASLQKTIRSAIDRALKGSVADRIRGTSSALLEMVDLRRRRGSQAR
jgi:hypothetical protein